jgi:DNA-damage-inducible protein D
MKKSIIKPAENIFESIKHTDDDGHEYWLARELMSVLDYQRWEGFHEVIKRAEVALSKIYPQTTDHFRQVTKMIEIATGSNKQSSRGIIDYKLTRRACYLIAQNGDSRKEAIALAQNYFASQTRKQELIVAREKDIERILARRKLTESEKKFAGVMNERGVDGKGIAEVKSAGDEALFGQPTQIVKNKLGIRKDKPLADHLPTISIKAKDLATEMTTFKTQEKDLFGKDKIKSEHITNNSAVRKMLTESGIYPERLPAQEDIKKLERKYSEQQISEVEEARLLAIDFLEIDIREVADEVELTRIRELIHANNGHSTLRIYYGSAAETKLIERSIQITPEVVDALRKYLVITDNSLA